MYTPRLNYVIKGHFKRVDVRKLENGVDAVDDERN